MVGCGESSRGTVRSPAAVVVAAVAVAAVRRDSVRSVGNGQVVAERRSHIRCTVAADGSVVGQLLLKFPDRTGTSMPDTWRMPRSAGTPQMHNSGRATEPGPKRRTGI